MRGHLYSLVVALASATIFPFTGIYPALAADPEPPQVENGKATTANYTPISKEEMEAKVREKCRSTLRLHETGSTPNIAYLHRGEQKSQSVARYCVDLVTSAITLNDNYLATEFHGAERVQALQNSLTTNSEMTDTELLLKTADLAESASDMEKENKSKLMENMHQAKQTLHAVDSAIQALRNSVKATQPIRFGRSQLSIRELKGIRNSVKELLDRSEVLVAMLGVSHQELDTIKAKLTISEDNLDSFYGNYGLSKGMVDAAAETPDLVITNPTIVRDSLSELKQFDTKSNRFVGDFAPASAVESDTENLMESDYWDQFATHGDRTFKQERVETPSLKEWNDRRKARAAERAAERSGDDDQPRTIAGIPLTGKNVGLALAGTAAFAGGLYLLKGGDKKGGNTKTSNTKPNQESQQSNGNGSTSTDEVAKQNLCFHHYNHSAWHDEGLAVIMCESTPKLDSCSIFDNEGKQLTGLQKHGSLDKNREVFGLYRTLGSNYPHPFEIRCRIDGSQTVGVIKINNGDKYQNGPGA